MARGWGSERTSPEERGPVEGPLRRKTDTDRVREGISESCRSSEPERVASGSAEAVEPQPRTLAPLIKWTHFSPPVSRRASRDDRKKGCWRVILLDFECGAGDAALANDRLQGTDSNLWMVWNGYGHRPKVAEPLHDDVASALPKI